jgi:putative transposase
VAPFVPPNRGRGKQPPGDLRVVVDAILSQTTEGCTWRGLPHDYPPWPDVRSSYDKWLRDGTWERLNAAPRRDLRVAEGREPEPSAGGRDSQSVKRGEGGEARGFEGGKLGWGRKRHILVDTLGQLLSAWVHGADLVDCRGAEIVLENGCAQVPSRALVSVDQGHERLCLHQWVAENTGIALEVVRRPAGAKGFVLLAKRWVVERTLAWLSRYRRLAKDFERLIESSATRLYIASVHLLVRRLAKMRANAAATLAA